MAHRLVRRGRVLYGDCGWQDERSPDFVQWWYFDAELEDGRRLMAILLPRAFGCIEGEDNGPDPTITLTVTDPSGRSRRTRTFYRGAFEAERDKVGVRFGESRIECEGGRYRLVIRTGDLGCDLEYAPVLPPWPPLPGRDGWVTPALLRAAQGPGAARGGWFHYASVLPRAVVRGSLTVAGQTSRVRGLGYHEQGRANLPFTRLFSYWYWNRCFAGEWTVLFPVAATTRRARNLPLRALLIARGERVVCDLFDPTGALLRHRVERSRYDPRSGRDVPARVAFSARWRGLRLRMTMDLELERERFRFEPFAEAVPLAPLWLQHLTRTHVELTWRGERLDLEAEGVFETMLSGAL